MTAVDVAIVNYVGAAMGQTLTTKHRTYDAMCKAQGWSFMPFVCDTMGGMHADSRKFIAKAGDLVRQRSAKIGLRIHILPPSPIPTT